MKVVLSDGCFIIKQTVQKLLNDGDIDWLTDCAVKTFYKGVCMFYTTAMQYVKSTKRWFSAFCQNLEFKKREEATFDAVGSFVHRFPHLNS